MTGILKSLAQNRAKAFLILLCLTMVATAHPWPTQEEDTLPSAVQQQVAETELTASQADAEDERDKTESADLVGGFLDWKHVLALVIALVTGAGAFLLIWLTFSRKHAAETRLGRRAEQNMALNIIVVVLIVEAVLICGILKVDPGQYEALYAAIAGYVLGTLKTQRVPSRAEEDSAEQRAGASREDKENEKPPPESGPGHSKPPEPTSPSSPP